MWCFHSFLLLPTEQQYQIETNRSRLMNQKWVVESSQKESIFQRKKAGFEAEKTVFTAKSNQEDNNANNREGMKKKESSFTPLMQQFLEIKKECKNSILFFRMGDFYEMFFEDAIEASKILGITLTTRDRNSENPTPMCGIPYHAVDGYLPKLIKAGRVVAICEQVEDPKQAKGIVKREVVRTVSPGTVIDEAQLPADESNNILSIAYVGKAVGVTLIELSTGLCRGAEFHERDRGRFLDYLSQSAFSEVVVNTALLDASYSLLKEIDKGHLCITALDEWYFDTNLTAQVLCEQFHVKDLRGFGIQGKKALICAAGGLVSYLKETQKSSLSHLERLKLDTSEETMSLDFATIRNLELTCNATEGTKKGTLLSVLDGCKTPMGKRTLREWVLRPLTNLDEINHRLSIVELFHTEEGMRTQLRELFKSVGDIERIAGRISLGNANGRDMIALRNALSIFPELYQLFEVYSETILKRLMSGWENFNDLVALITETVVENPPFSIREGGMIKPEANSELKEIDQVVRNSAEWLASFEKRIKEESGITSLKVGFNKVYGYYIEVTKKNAHLVPESFVRKQSLVNGERFINEELKQYEEQVLSADEKKRELEYKLFLELLSKVNERREDIVLASRRIAAFDIFSAFAHIALSKGYCKPLLGNDRSLSIEEGRHPVIENQSEECFVPNTLYMNGEDRKVGIVTGPNMAGKSTFLRQNALIVLMAQIGSYVPATKAEIGIVDRIFTRVGAQDNLYRGQSTFMVEMSEAANILNNASSSSLVILDEIGRGTSTFDGLSIAWAIVEYMVEKIHSRTLFATHYHELTTISALYNGIFNLVVKVDEYDKTISFTRQVVEGKADKSYGIHVAKLAGVPQEVVSQAEVILNDLEKGNVDQYGFPKIDLSRVRSLKEREIALQPSLFDAKEEKEKQAEAEQEAYSETVQALKKIEPDLLSPKDALEALYQLCELMKKEENKKKEK